MTRNALVFTASLALTLSACSGASETDDAGDSAPITEAEVSATLVEVVQGDSELSILKTSIEMTGLGPTLSGNGPYTIFAPTDAAFGKIDPAMLELIVSDNSEAPVRILPYHVVEGLLDAATLVEAIADAGEGGYAITTLDGAAFTATSQEGAIILTDANGGTASISAADVEASNGLIHIIDGVLMP